MNARKLSRLTSRSEERRVGKECWGVLGPCLPIENVDAVYFYCSIEDLTIHSCILCMCVGWYDAREEHHQDCGSQTNELSGVRVSSRLLNKLENDFEFDRNT